MLTNAVMKSMALSCTPNIVMHTASETLYAIACECRSSANDSLFQMLTWSASLTAQIQFIHNGI